MGMNSRIRALGNIRKHETAWELGIKWELMIEKRQVLVAYRIHSSRVFHNAISLNKSLLEDKENILIFDTNIRTDFPVKIHVCVCLLILSAKAYLWLYFVSGMSYMLQYILGKVNYEWYLKAELCSHIINKVLSLDGTFRWGVDILIINLKDYPQLQSQHN